MFQNLLAKLGGKYIASKLRLKDGPMGDTKKWYQSKGVWAGVVAVLVGAYGTAATQFNLPAIPDWIYSLLGALGVYGRVTATKEISS